MNRVITACAAAIATALVLAGCSAGQSVDLGDTGGSGGALNAAIGGEPDQLDPQKTSSYFSFEVLENVFDTLVEPDENLEMQPALAERWETSDDQLTWTFHLRDDVVFQDGSEFSSADVVYSYRRIIDEKLANAWKFSTISDISAPDDSTVVITLTQPTPNLLSNLGGFKGMAIVQKANVESGDIATAPIGTGPFSVSEYTQGDHITLKANPDYWGGAPKLDGVTFRFISEPATALAALKSGEIQWTDVVPTQQVDQLEGDSSLTLGQEPSSDYWYLALNEAREPWSDVRVRQAIAYAIDRSAILKAVSYARRGRTSSPSPRAVSGTRPTTRTPPTSRRPRSSSPTPGSAAAPSTCSPPATTPRR